MRIGILTSSRADYSIYLPLLKKLRSEPSFDLKIIAFGTHISEKYGYTVNEIIKDGFEVEQKFNSSPEADSPEAIAVSIEKTFGFFSRLWSRNEYDLVFCLGDRYEMFAACAAGVPFGIKFAHIHGGEQTLGAIDEVFRHCLTHMATYHFAAAQVYADRIAQIKNSHLKVYFTGALSIDNLLNLKLLSANEFNERYAIDISKPSILITFHPETVDYEKNESYTNELIGALKMIKGYQYIITMPNSDTMGLMIRSKLMDFIYSCESAFAIESFGTIGYLSCMKHCSFMLGNTSSGFIEASYFPKYVINLGNRQKGRIQTSNIVSVEIDQKVIVEAVNNFETIDLSTESNVYGNGQAADAILEILKGDL
jgi:GDP/UDP-N,N'-diacetylbacillosamine 2-epimerase (hydrolysing)